MLEQQFFPEIVKSNFDFIFINKKIIITFVIVLSNKLKRVTINISFPSNQAITTAIIIIIMPSHFISPFHMNLWWTFFTSITIDTDQYWIFINTFVNKETLANKNFLFDDYNFFKYSRRFFLESIFFGLINLVRHFEDIVRWFFFWYLRF